ncbi:MAG: sigma 54-interacting transcriptional regulator [Pirellulales bacterium]|nr:sigma 54-interacting transcriptional regulator [Pirellulales bacterium]
MASFTSAERHSLATFARMAYTNPFLAERIKLEHAVLGDQYVPEQIIAWSKRADQGDRDRLNVERLTTLATMLVNSFCERLSPESTVDGSLLENYWDTATYVLYYRHMAQLERSALVDPGRSLVKIWRTFCEDMHIFAVPLRERQFPLPSAEHLFACLFQLRRAFLQIYDHILGDSQPATRLRAMVWQSIFTHDMRRYRKTVYRHLGELPTLITGPTGTGKELVARAIGLSQYVPFDPQSEKFGCLGDVAFYPLNLSALSPTLIESELFGHRRGAYTGAATDRVGWLEACKPAGAVFLDEIGELDAALQVKLLRVAQQRTFSRLGETDQRHFTGKLIAATNRNLQAELAAGRFREDLYYRLCADRITTPSLCEQLRDRPTELRELVTHVSRRIAGDEAEEFADEVVAWIEEHLGPNYPWRGNIRELEQCVRNLLVRREYLPLDGECITNPPVSAANASDPPLTMPPQPAWIMAAWKNELTADELLRQYCTWVYAQTSSYERSAERLGLDRRTIKSKVDPELLRGYQAGKSSS